MTVLREPIPGLLIPGWLCCDCKSCDSWGICHQRERYGYVGRWKSSCSALRLRPKAAADAAEEDPNA